MTSIPVTADVDQTRQRSGADELDPESEARLGRMERKLIWTRRTALMAWGLVLYIDGGFRGPDTRTIVYLCAVAYMEVLHWHLRRSRNMRVTRRVAASGDSLLAFTMCFMHGGASSVFIPHFYLTVMAAAFRFGARDSKSILVLNLLLLGILVVADTMTGAFPVKAIFVVQYMFIAFVLGTILSGWATANLRIAMDHAGALEEERDRSNSLLRRLIDAQEEERTLLAEDLHDRMGESLFSIGHGLDACIAESRTPDAQPQLTQRLVDVRRRLMNCTSYVRSFLNELRPNVLDELGLCEALSEYVASLRDIVPFAIELRLDPALAQWRSRQDAMLFRLIQEAILNCRKHANATKMVISLERGVLDEVTLEIADNGKGFSTSRTPSGHYGLSMMRERAMVSGGRLAIESAPGAGARILVRFSPSKEDVG